MNLPKRQLIIPTSIDLVRIAPERIVYISSDGNYSTLVQADGEMRMLSFQLGQVEKMIADQLGSEGNNFIRIGKSLQVSRESHPLLAGHRLALQTALQVGARCGVVYRSWRKIACLIVRKIVVSARLNVQLL